MLRIICVILLTNLSFSLSGCASAPPLSAQAAQVRTITTQQAGSCKFVRVAQYDDRILSVGKDATVMRSIGENNLRNAVANLGANAMLITKEDSNWFLGTVSYQADAYNCP
ncbi:DUF4156 domain-containing protein [Noviherbaspirillum album]|uniref:DUF4156 domain-containing protein n=1 Tax=Noviherbaspirillum album TaxID=3080276 RepID=UPI003460E6E9